MASSSTTLSVLQRIENHAGNDDGDSKINNDNLSREDQIHLLNKSKYNLSFLVLNFVVPFVGLALLVAEIMETNQEVFYKNECRNY